MYVVKLLSLVLLSTFLSLSFPLFATVYSWEDVSGRIHYTNSPPADSGAKEYHSFQTEEPKSKSEEEKQKSLYLLEQQALEIKKQQEQKNALLKKQEEVKEHGRLCKISYYQMGSFLPDVVHTFTLNRHKYAQAAKEILTGYRDYGMNNYILKCKSKSINHPDFVKAITCFVSVSDKQQFSQCLTTLIEVSKQKNLQKVLI